MWTSRLTALGWGALGVVIVLLLVHAWFDHAALHSVVDMINANAAKQQQLQQQAK